MEAIPIQAPSRYGPRAFENNTLPSISRHDGSFPRPLPFGASNRHIPFPDAISPSSASNPMAIRGSDNYCDAPPPLPPPRLVPISDRTDPALQKEYMNRRDEYSPSETSDSFGLTFKRRDISFKSRFPDEGYQSIDSSYRSVPHECKPTVAGLFSASMFARGTNPSVFAGLLPAFLLPSACRP